MRHIAISIAAAILFAGCMSTGKDFPTDTNWIKKGSTKQKDVSLILGAPYAVGDSGGIKTWIYAFYEYSLFGGTYYKELKFYWSDDTSVQHYNFSSSFPKDKPQ